MRSIGSAVKSRTPRSSTSPKRVMDTLRFSRGSRAFPSIMFRVKNFQCKVGKVEELGSDYVLELERLVSKPRLERYRPDNRDDLETAVHYLWNVALSEALPQALAALEIAMRNAIHSTFSQHLGTDYWFQ